jgi:hypothetical protein
MNAPCLGLVGLLALLPFAGKAQAEITGLVAVEVRYFPEAPLFEGQHKDVSTSLVFQPEFYRTLGDQSLLFTPYFRVDQYDDERTHFDVRELLFRYSAERWQAKIGVGKVYWGVTESVHLVDIINQTDLVDDPDGEDKLGQPMVQLSAYPDGFGDFDFFVMPYFRERTFAGPDGRLRPGPLVAVDDAEYESGAEEYHMDTAVRWSRVVGDMDVGLSHFYGTSREPEFRPRPISETNVELVPYYKTIHQTGVDAQYTRDGILLKMEGIYGDEEFAVAGGFEYTFVGLMGSNADLGWLVEMLYNENAAAAFEEDLFSGFRYTPNDVQSTELLAGIIQDLDTDTRYLNVEASRRLGDRYTLSLHARWFSGVDVKDPVYSTRDDDYVQIELARYF